MCSSSHCWRKRRKDSAVPGLPAACSFCSWDIFSVRLLCLMRCATVPRKSCGCIKFSSPAIASCKVQHRWRRQLTVHRIQEFVKYRRQPGEPARYLHLAEVDEGLAGEFEKLWIVVSPYRIRRSQENHQFLCQARGRRDRGRRQPAGRTRGTATMGRGPAAAMAGSDGSDLVQRLDLRHAEALRRAVGDGASRQNESHHRGRQPMMFATRGWRTASPLRSQKRYRTPSGH